VKKILFTLEISNSSSGMQILSLVIHQASVHSRMLMGTRQLILKSKPLFCHNISSLNLRPIIISYLICSPHLQIKLVYHLLFKWHKICPATGTSNHKPTVILLFLRMLMVLSYFHCVCYEFFKLKWTYTDAHFNTRSTWLADENTSFFTSRVTVVPNIQYVQWK